MNNNKIFEFSRTEMLIGSKGLDILRNSHITIIGIGGVGSFVAEGLARCGIGHFTLVDNDNICITNINRQIHANYNTIGRSKVKVMKERILSINNLANIKTFNKLYNVDSAEEILSKKSNYIVDAIDMVSAKLDLVERCIKNKKNIISCLGTGNKLKPTMLEITDISKTFNCPLAKIMRKELKKRGIEHLKVLFSSEQKIKPKINNDNDRKNIVPGSISFVPSVAGMIIASEIVENLLHQSPLQKS